MKANTSLSSVVVLALLASFLFVGVCLAQRPLTPREQDLKARSSHATANATRPSGGELGTAFIRYDPGAPADVIATSPLSLVVGNIFNSTSVNRSAQAPCRRFPGTKDRSELS
jgi:hypothetical protein